eukprot:39458-Rhodomonas_salina.1
MSGTDAAYAATSLQHLDVQKNPLSVASPLSAYALATRCPVLTWRMLLPGGFCAAHPGTAPSSAIMLCFRYAKSGIAIGSTA